MNNTVARKSKYLVAIMVSLSLSKSLYAETALQPDTISPDGKVAVYKDESRCYFYNTEEGAVIGDILSSSENTRLSNVNILASWNSLATRVALLIYYGSKLNEVRIFQKNNDGKMVALDVLWPNLSELASSKGKDIGKIMENPGFDENSLGPWLDDDTVNVIIAEAKESDRGTLHFILLTKLHCSGNRVSAEPIGDLKIMNDAESSELFDRWGKRYWETK